MVLYSGHSFLKKGPLGRAWAAAHFERKLGRNQISEADIVKIAGAILDPEAHFSLRIFAYLLLGLVRLYSRKLDYLLRDSSESLRKIKKSFPLPVPSNGRLAAAQVVITTVGVDFDEIEPLSDHVWSADHNVSLAEHITLSVRDEDGNDLFFDDERFPPECTLQAFEEPASKSFPSEASHEPGVQETEADEADVADEPDLQESEGNDESLVFFEPRTPPTKAAFNPRIQRLREEPIQRPPVHRALATEFEKFLSKNRAGISVSNPELESRERIENKRARAGPTDEYGLDNALSESCLGPSVDAICSKEYLLEACQLAEGNSPRTPMRSTSRPRKRKRIAFDTPSILTQELLREQLLDVSDLIRSRKKVHFRSLPFSGPSVPGMCGGLQEVFARSPKARASDTEPCSAPNASKEAADEPFAGVASQLAIAVVNKVVDHSENPEELEEDEPDQTPADTPLLDSDSSELPLDFSCLDQAEAEAETEETCTSSNAWSERTKALGHYLKSVLSGGSRLTPSVKLDRVLANKSRRIAACTFFDLLVLKTRSYIQVEQSGAYQAIQITSRPKLMEDASL